MLRDVILPTRIFPLIYDLHSATYEMGFPPKYFLQSGIIISFGLTKQKRKLSWNKVAFIK